MPALNVVGPRVREARLRLGMTQEDLAAKLQVEGIDISRQAVAKLEIRLRTVRDYELAALARVLAVEAAWLLEEAGGS